METHLLFSYIVPKAARVSTLLANKTLNLVQCL